MIIVHRYLRSIGFSRIRKREELQALINEVVERTILNPSESDKKKMGEKEQAYAYAKDIAADEDDRVYAELSFDFVHGAGICVRGEFDDDNSFISAQMKILQLKDKRKRNLMLAFVMILKLVLQ